MFTTIVTPRFGDMDVMGHINQAVPVAWFELARNPLFKIFDPQMKLSRENFPLIMAHTEYDYIDQIFFPHDVKVRTWIGRIGNKSFTTCHEAWQQGRLCVTSSAVIVHYNFNIERSIPLTGELKARLSEHAEAPAAAAPLT